MAERSKIRKLENWEVHHKVLLFAIVFIATILIVRFIVYYVADPNPSIFGFELHHFDYGLFLLVMTMLFMLFVGKYHRTYIIASAVAIGLIVDQLWFIRGQVKGNMPQLYNPSLAYVLILALIVVLIAVLIHYLFTKKSKK